MAESEDVTLLLKRMSDGDSEAVDELMPLIYGEMRKLAAHFLYAERPDHTLQPTALVHEAFIRMVDQTDADFRSRGHFMSIAGLVMRRILVNHAKAKQAKKRGGGAARITLDKNAIGTEESDVDLVALDEALVRLGRQDERKVRVVEQRFFIGLELKEIADNIGVSLATIKRDWEFARAWLTRELLRDE
ncbi:MAG: sigma-70 family RNA polymerase sigma factor [Planctomycetota bacterium]|jgi:RNA polymerase sigma factor (TIGR02999 family)